MDVRALLLGSKPKMAAIALLLVLASLVGAYAFGAIGAPAVTGVENRFGPVTEERTYVLTDLHVHNPNPVGVQLGGTNVSYTVVMNDVRMANGTKSGLQIESGNSTLRFNTTMFNDRIPPWWVSHVRGGERTNVTVDATVRTSVVGERAFDVTQKEQVETEIIGQFNSNETRPVYDRDGDDVVLYVNRTGAEWGDVSRQRTPIDMEFVVFNPDRLKPYAVTKIGYEITMNDVAVGGGETESVATVIEPRTTETIRPTTVIQNDRLDDWWVSHLERNQVTDLRIDFYAVIEVAGTRFRVPLEELTYEKEIETDVFGNENGTIGGDGGDGGDGRGDGSGEGTGDATPTATPDDGTGDGTPTASPSPTPTASPTETDDGGILGGLAGVRGGETPSWTVTRTRQDYNRRRANDGYMERSSHAPGRVLQRGDRGIE